MAHVVFQLLVWRQVLHALLLPREILLQCLLLILEHSGRPRVAEGVETAEAVSSVAVVALRSRREPLLPFLGICRRLPYRGVLRFVFLARALLLLVVQLDKLWHHDLAVPLEHRDLSLRAASQFRRCFPFLAPTRFELIGGDDAIVGS